MIKLLVLSMLIVSASYRPVVADNSICPTLGELAKTIMTKRQENVPISALMTALASIYSNDDKQSVVIRQLIVMAYQSPRFSTPEYVNNSIASFSNEAMTACYANT